jgi:probable blue pigment (indigoidine) exporter
MPVRPRSAVFLVAAALFWGLGTVLTKYALNGFTSTTLLPLQLMCSVALLGAAVAVRKERLDFTPENRRAALLGVLNPGIAYALGLLGLARIDASVSVVLWATEPVLIMILAVLILRERVKPASALALLIAMLGVLLIVGRPSGTATVVGVLLTLAAVTACALYSIVLRRMHLVDGTLPIVFMQQVTALAFALLVFAVVSAIQDLGPTSPTSLELGAAVAGGALYYGAAFWVYVSGLRRTTAARAGMYLTLIPVFGLVFSWLLLDERLNVAQVLGAVLVIGSLAAVGFPQVRRERVRTSTSQPPR